MLEAAGESRPPSKSRAPPQEGRRCPPGYRVAEVYFERRGGRSIVGNIYKGKVDNVLPGLEAAFVDIGLDKNGFLHVDEIVLPGVEQVKRGRGKEPGPRITDLLKPGQEIVVQVVKDPLKTKGARLSMELTIAGRYMVYAPTGEGVGVSRRLEDKERDRLRKEAKQLDLGGGGAIIRTAAHGATREDFERELQYLFKLNEVLEKRVEESDRARARLPGGRPLGPRRARHLLRALRARGRRRPASSTTGSSRSSRAPRPSSSTASSCGRTTAAAVRGLRRRPGDRGDALAPRRPAERRLPDDRLRRGADGHRRQHRLVHRQGQGRPARGHDHQDEPRGGRGGRQPAAAARHRRHHRHRLHRHGARAQPRRGAQGRCARRSTRTARRPSWSRSRRSGWSR